MTLLLEVGKITRPQGLRGEVMVSLTTTQTGRLAPGAVLQAGDRELVVKASRPHQKRWVVLFEGFTSREAAETLRDVQLFALPGDLADDDDPDALWVHELIGAEVVDLAGTSYGVVESVLANPASDLLVLESGALVPLTFVTRWRDRPTMIEIDPPAGLFDTDDA